MEIPLHAFQFIAPGVHAILTPTGFSCFVREGIYKVVLGHSTYFVILEDRIEIGQGINAPWIHPEHHSHSFFNHLLYCMPYQMLQTMDPNLLSFDALQILLRQTPAFFWYYHVHNGVAQALRSMARVASFEPFKEARCFIPSSSLDVISILFKLMQLSGSELARIPFNAKNLNEIVERLDQWLGNVSDNQLGILIKQHDDVLERYRQQTMSHPTN